MDKAMDKAMDKVMDKINYPEDFKAKARELFPGSEYDVVHQFLECGKEFSYKLFNRRKSSKIQNFIYLLVVLTHINF